MKLDRKSFILAIVTACGLTAQVGAPTMNAQIPFAFEFRGQQFSPGRYEIKRTPGHQAILVRNRDTGLSAAALWTSSDTTSDARNGVVFVKSGDKYYLRSVLEQRTANAYHVPAAKGQLEAAKLIAPATVFIAAR